MDAKSRENFYALLHKAIKTQMKPTPKIDILAEQIDLIINGKTVKGQKVPLGLTVHFSTTEKRWWAGYGRKNTNYKTYGDSAENALKNLIDRLNTPINQDITA